MTQKVKKLVKREIFPQIFSHLTAPEISVIIGPRQTGKSTLLSQLKDHLIKNGHPESKIFIFNLDIVTDSELFTSQQKFISFLKERTSKEKLYVFVDEAQRVENSGRFFKGVYDLDLPVKIVLTGSSVLEIKAKIHESLTGRKRVFHLYPFSFTEYLSVYDESLAEIAAKENISSYSQNRLLEHLFSFINWGGYPKQALKTDIAEKQEDLKELFSSYIEKDIVGFLKIKNRSAFMRLVITLASQIGQMVNMNEISRSLRIERKTAEKYVEILEKTFIIKEIRPFFKNYRKELVKMPKIYFLDTGFRDFAVKSFADFEMRQDKGALLENFVFSEIYKQTDTKIHFWRTKEKAEVDFVLTDYAGKILPVEIKAAFLKKPEISQSFRSFVNRYKPEKAALVNLGFRGEVKINQTEIMFIHPYEVRRIIRPVAQ